MDKVAIYIYFPDVSFTKKRDQEGSINVEADGSILVPSLLMDSSWESSSSCVSNQGEMKCHWYTGMIPVYC